MMSLKKMKQLKYSLRRPTAILFLISSLFALGIWGCSNDDPSKTKTVSVDITALKNQLNLNSNKGSNEKNSTRLESFDNSAATNVIKTLILGPLSFATHGTPYSLDEPYLDQEEDFIEGDLPNSLAFITFVSLPTTETKVEFEVPVTSSGWQVLVLASSEDITSLADFDEEDNQNSIVYYGFSDDSYETAEELSDANPTLQIRRLCIPDSLDSSKYKDPVKGCAIYDDQQESLVSAAVEILGVNVNGAAADPTALGLDFAFPIIVRTNPNDNQSSVDEAETALDDLSDSLTGTVSSLEVVVSHRENPAETAACQALGDTASVAEYKANCETQEYQFIY